LPTITSSSNLVFNKRGANERFLKRLLLQFMVSFVGFSTSQNDKHKKDHQVVDLDLPA